MDTVAWSRVNGVRTHDWTITSQTRYLLRHAVTYNFYFLFKVNHISDNTQETDYSRKCIEWFLISLLGYTDCEPFCQFNPSQPTLTHSSAVIFPSKFSSPSSCSFLQISLNSSVTCTYRFVPIFQPLMSQIFYKINTHGQDSNNNTTTCHFKINPTTKPCQTILYLL